MDIVFLKDCLLMFNYPLAHSMKDEEIADIFKISNRCFLISWMLRLLDSAYEEVLENLENNEEFLGNLVYELGFCTKKEKLPFMNGELPVDQQIMIIHNMFTYIKDIRSYKPEEAEEAVTMEELTAFTHTDLNLFPQYGKIKLLTPEERALKKEYVKNNQTDASTSKVVETHALNGNFNQDILEFIAMLKNDFPKIRNAVESLSKNRNMERQDIIELKPNSVETMKKCSANMKIISQFIKDVNTIEDFEKLNPSLSEQIENSSTYGMIKALHRDVFTALNYHKHTQNIN